MGMGFVPKTEELQQPLHGSGYIGENEMYPATPRYVDPIKEFARELTHATRNRSVESIFEEEDRAVRTEEALRELVEQGRIQIRPKLRGFG